MAWLTQSQSHYTSVKEAVACSRTPKGQTGTYFTGLVTEQRNTY